MWSCRWKERWYSKYLEICVAGDGPLGTDVGEMLARRSRMATLNIQSWWRHSGKHKTLPRCKRFLLSLTQGWNEDGNSFHKSKVEYCGHLQNGWLIQDSRLKALKSQLSRIRWKGIYRFKLLGKKTSVIDLNLGMASRIQMMHSRLSFILFPLWSCFPLYGFHFQ